MSNGMPALAHDRLSDEKTNQRAHHSAPVPLHLVEPTVAIQRSSAVPIAPSNPSQLAAFVEPTRRSRGTFALPLNLIGPAVAFVDFILIVGASVVAGFGYHLLFLDYLPPLGPYVVIGAIAYLHFVTILLSIGAYQLRNLIAFKLQVYRVGFTWIGVCFILLGMAFALKIGQVFSRGASFGLATLGVLSLLVWRETLVHLLGNALAKGRFAKRKTIVIAERSKLLASRVLPELQRYGYALSAIFEVDESEKGQEGTELQGGLADMVASAIRVARQQEIDDILLVVGWERGKWIEVIRDALSVLPIPIRLVPEDRMVDYLARTYSVGSIWMAELKRAPLSGLERALKRTVDLCGAAGGLLLVGPLLLATAALIKIQSGGPVLFTQWRSGFNGRLFRIFKLRTMTVLEDGPVIRQATRDDPRVTRMGRWLRRTNIDELPQLFNVLRGEMSLVGPRPHATAHDSEYQRQIAAYAFRYHVKPGITGWAQLKGYRGETRTLDLMSRRVELDLWYIENWSLWLDLKILVGTLTREIWRPRGY
jgi:Undecaprenyl-phosphate glucose phosphotransferase